MSSTILDDIIDFLAVFPYGSLDKLRSSIKLIDNATFNIILTDFKDNSFKSLDNINSGLIREFISIITTEYNFRQSKIHVVKTIISPAVIPSISPTLINENKPIILSSSPPIAPPITTSSAMLPITHNTNIVQRIMYAMKLFVSLDGYSDISLTLQFLNKNNSLDSKYSKFKFIELLKGINKFQFNKFNNFFKLK